jgi:hypothetical protein
MSEETEFCLTGNLGTDSPALLSDLQRGYENRAVRYLASCYAEASKWGGLREAPVEREAGVSYNPRPARILKILMKETNQVSVFSASVALFSTVPVQFREQVASAYQKQKDAVSGLDILETCDELLQNIALARTLDSARHLHMTVFEPAERLEIYRDFKRRLEYWSSTFKTPDNERLFLTFEQWVESSGHLFSS